MPWQPLMAGKWLQLLTEIAPAVKRVAIWLCRIKQRPTIATGPADNSTQP
jgi:hypothetical protein